jgi:hypothetical protein
LEKYYALTGFNHNLDGVSEFILVPNNCNRQQQLRESGRLQT